MLLVAASSYVSAQAPQATGVEVEPLTCWWRTSVASVRVGESFGVVLTCAALETDAARTVVDRTRLGPAAVQFPPYEVLGGRQHPDHVTAGRRFMQYEYTLRLVGEDAFGVDVPIAGLDVSYRIESRVEQEASLQGREQSYELPALPMRITSLVADGARSIRESNVPTFADIASRELRARTFRIVALFLFGIAALTVAVALVRWVRQSRSQSVQAARPLLTTRAVLDGVRRELAAIRAETMGGWSPDAVARALAAARVVAGYQAGQPVVQRAIDGPAGAGEIALGGGWLGRRPVAVSASATASEEAPGAGVDPAAGELTDALRRLTAARYGRAPDLDASALADALDATRRAADRVAARHTWAAEAGGLVRQTVRGWGPRAWAR